MRLDLDRMRDLLSEGAARDADMRGALLDEAARQAAVALVLQSVGDDSKLLLIRRAEREGDPWSGHMALPGGHAEPEDHDSAATAMRETLEEVGLPLRREECLGTMAPLQVSAFGRPTGMWITPHVFAVQRPADLSPNAEVAATFWAPVSPMAMGEWDSTKHVQRGNVQLKLPAIDVHGNLVWGLTLKMITTLFSVLKLATEPAG